MAGSVNKVILVSAESRFRAGCARLIEGHRGDKPHGQGSPIMAR